jgi:hypothetical protein
MRTQCVISLMVLAAFMLIGCAGDITIRMSLPRPGTVVQETNLAEVKVNDLRKPGIAASKREAAFGTPMGNITFQPPEAKLIKTVIENELSNLLNEKGIKSIQTYECDLIEFGVNTITTALYWDVVCRIRLTLKHGGKEYNLFGTDTERTYVWPGEEIIMKVVDGSLKQIVAGLKPVAQSM